MIKPAPRPQISYTAYQQPDPNHYTIRVESGTGLTRVRRGDFIITWENGRTLVTPVGKGDE